MYQRILLAYDGSVEGRTALREGALLARRYRAQVFLLSVIPSAAGHQLGEGVGGEGTAQQQDQYRAVLREGMARLQQMGFEASARLAFGEPANEIGAYAAQIQADLVIVGHRRQSAFSRWWSGPSGAYLIDHIRCSLLVCQNVMDEATFRAALERETAAASNTAAPAPTGTGQGSATARAAAHGASAPAEPERAISPRRRRVRWALFLLLPIVLIIGIWLYVTGGAVVSTDDAYVEARTVGLSTDVSGIVSSVDVQDNQRVAAAQVVFRLDDRPFRYALERAEGQLGTVRDQLIALQASYRQMQAEVRQAQVDVNYNLTQYQRAANLVHVHFVSKSAYDVAQRGLLSAQQRLASLNAQLAGIVADLNGAPLAPIEQNPRYLSAMAQRDEAARELAHTVVRAPFAGTVTRVSSLEPGHYLGASSAGFYLVDTADVWITAQPKETDLTWVRAGQPVSIHIDTYPDRLWHGTVQSISPAASQQFALLPAQNTSGNWVKVVQRIPLRIRVESGDMRLPPLRAGMSAEIDVNTGHARGWPHF